jgi:hypothetical protein
MVTEIPERPNPSRHPSRGPSPRVEPLKGRDFALEQSADRTRPRVPVDVSDERPIILCEEDHAQSADGLAPKATHFFRNVQSGRVKAVCSRHFDRLQLLALSKIEDITEDEYVIYLVMES